MSTAQILESTGGILMAIAVYRVQRALTGQTYALRGETSDPGVNENTRHAAAPEPYDPG